jgi:hypothetical protein
VVRPRSKEDPEIRVQETSRIPILSLAVGAPKETGAVSDPPAADTATSEGQVMDGAMLSLTETVKTQLDISVALSTAKQVIVVFEELTKEDPDGGSQ